MGQFLWRLALTLVLLASKGCTRLHTSEVCPMGASNTTVSVERSMYYKPYISYAYILLIFILSLWLHHLWAAPLQYSAGVVSDPNQYRTVPHLHVQIKLILLCMTSSNMATPTNLVSRPECACFDLCTLLLHYLLIKYDIIKAMQNYRLYIF